MISDDEKLVSVDLSDPNRSRVNPERLHGHDPLTPNRGRC
jgi:hypothetical protein